VSAQPTLRDQSLDSFRGLDVLLMILVNLQGSAVFAAQYIKHADWNGITLADFVFPVFLLIVGLSAPLAIERPGVVVAPTTIVRRALLLFLIGVGLGMAIKGQVSPETIRWTGVLQRIAIVYLACAAIMALRRGVALPITAALGALIVHSYLLLFVGSPDGSLPSLAPGEGISGWLDRNVLPGRVHRGSWDPEGVLSTLPAIASALIGVAVMRRISAKGLATIWLGAIGAALVVIGLALTPWLPLNKNLWTASFALVTSGGGLLFWAGLRALWPFIETFRLARWTVEMGQTALTLYVIHMLLIALIVRKLPDGKTLWATSFDALAATGLNPALASMLYAVVGTALSCALIPPLRKRGWLLKV
jgi:predicted acyltransferase